MAAYFGGGCEGGAWWGIAARAGSGRTADAYFGGRPLRGGPSGGGNDPFVVVVVVEADGRLAVAVAAVVVCVGLAHLMGMYDGVSFPFAAFAAALANAFCFLLCAFMTSMRRRLASFAASLFLLAWAHSR